MYDWSLMTSFKRAACSDCFSCCWKDVRLKRHTTWSGNPSCSFQLLLKGCTIEAVELGRMHLLPVSFSCCWKDVRLKLRILYQQTLLKKQFQLLLKGCTIEARLKMLTHFYLLCFSCCWKDVRLKPQGVSLDADVVKFQLLLKGCTIEATSFIRLLRYFVSVVVERMYDWSSLAAPVLARFSRRFSCCWKDVRLKLPPLVRNTSS